jgi:predicted site-specific integrase-resolvase
MLTAREVCDSLGIHANTLRRWRQGGTLVKGVHWVQFSAQTIRYDAGWMEKFRQTGGKGSHKLEVLAALRDRR